MDQEKKLPETVDNEVETGTFIESIKILFKTHKKTVKAIAIVLAGFLVIYLLASLYFINHFYLGTRINDIGVSGKTLAQVEEIMQSERANYILLLKKRGGQKEEIKAQDVGLKYRSDQEFANVKQSQNPYKWPIKILDTKALKYTIEFSWDDALLKSSMNQLSGFDENQVIEPKDPSFTYKGNSYMMTPELQGNKIDENILYEHISRAIKNREKEMNLDLLDCYISPKYKADSKEVLEAQKILNLYVTSKIIHTFGDEERQLDGNVIHKWLLVGEDFKVTINKEKVNAYVKDLAKKYNTVGKTRTMKTPSGKSIKVSGGDYGWSINQSKEAEQVIKAIKNGETVTKKPEYNQTAFSYGSNDIGNTFVEIDLTKQHIWFYKNKVLITEGDIVTGNVSKNHTTPKGVYRLKYKVRDAVLRGDDYESPVSFWMPFNKGIGMHDASWRSKFGGTIYKKDGSHGCINCPYDVAKAIYNNIEANTPVICH